ncbi:MAG: DNA repair protein RecN [Thermoanaerobacterales bacterium 50_218]|nr:MAG: DNA repair protein RecN [Thermoanaerobacterales bacterium 50_218]HAA90453.1 DNA repair protein RecN [Peptococcaceae bacterium]
MLVQLEVENLALIEKISLNFGPGLNVLTGETGAGKSILVDAMSLLVGERASGDQVRTGAEKAFVGGLFDCQEVPQVLKKLEELGLPVSEDSTLLLTREIVRGGRSVCRVNGKMVPLSLYRVLGELLVDLHGQHEHQSLLKVSRHRELLDAFGGEKLQQQRELVQDLYQRLVSLKQALEGIQDHQKEYQQKIEDLRHVVEEIDRVNPTPGEEEDLEQERERLRHREKLLELVKGSIFELSEGTDNILPASDLISQAVLKLREMVHYDPSTAGVLQELEDLQYKLDDIVRFLREYQERLDFDPERATEVEERLYQLRKLMRKYGPSLESVCAYRNQAAAELKELLSLQDRSQEVEEEYTGVLREYEQAANSLSELRHQVAKEFSAAVEEELRALGMEKARFDILWKKHQQPTPSGFDQIEFVFSPNPGEPLKPLARIASGGEMSRVMLALKVVLAEKDEIPTLVFDEIDAGIGGRTLQVVGERLARLAECKQVLCVTHSPHIAGRGQRHFYIEKVVTDEQTRTVARLLDGEERIAEIARMLGGSCEEKVTRLHAEQILKHAYSE